MSTNTPSTVILAAGLYVILGLLSIDEPTLTNSGVSSYLCLPSRQLSASDIPLPFRFVSSYAAPVQ
ncbi:MAG: hypothetical protein ACRYFU_09135 [Janthinobacterium lividum]